MHFEPWCFSQSVHHARDSVRISSNYLEKNKLDSTQKTADWDQKEVKYFATIFIKIKILRVSEHHL